MAEADANTPSPDYEAMEAKRLLPRWLMGGTEVLLSDDVRPEVLPQLPGEDNGDYEFRWRHLSVLDPFYTDAVDRVVSGILGEGIAVSTEAPPELLDFWDNVDKGGRKGQQFWTAILEEAVGESISYVYVDHTGARGQARTKGEEESLGARPFWVHARGENVIETLPDSDGNLLRARIRERARSRNGYEWTTSTRVRELNRGNPDAPLGDPARYATYEVFEYNKKLDEWESMGPPAPFIPPNGLPEHLERLFVEIPLFPVYGRYLRPWFAEPPLKHLARLVQLFFLRDSDRNNIEHFANVPRRVIEGMTYEQFVEYQGGADKIAASNTIYSSAGSKVYWAEHGGTAIGALDTSQDKLAMRIKRASVDPMMRDASPNERATVRVADEKDRLSRYQVIAISAQDAFYNVMLLTAAWKGIEVTAAELAEWFAWPDPDPTALFMDQGDFLIQLRGGRPSISAAGAIEEAQRTGRLSPAVDAELEKQRLAEESSAALI